jgi:hypothetical protein
MLTTVRGHGYKLGWYPRSLTVVNIFGSQECALLSNVP